MKSRRWRCLGLAAGTIVLGLVLRLAPLPLPFWLYKYGGSALWAVMVFWLVAAVWPLWRAGRVGLVAMVIAAAVELFKLVPGAGLDAFRGTLAGRLLLGKYFSVWDLVVYAAAILAMAGGGSGLRKERIREAREGAVTAASG